MVRGDAREKIRERFGQALRDVMAAQGVSPTELAERLGVSPSGVTNWTRGRKEPQDFWVVFDLERALQLPSGTLSRILGFCPCEGDVPSLEGAILNADYLPEKARRALLATHHVWKELVSEQLP